MPDNATGLTLYGLLPLITSCINLRELTVRVDAVNAIPNAAQLRNIVPALKLEHLDVSRSPADDAIPISYFIKTVFLNLRILRDRWDLGGPNWYYDLDPVEEENYQCWEDIRWRSGARGR